jgi:magnesium transporter
MDFIVDNYEPAMERLEDEFEVLEESVFKGPFDKLSIERLYELKRELLTLRNAAAPVVEMCTELMRFHEELIPKEIRVYFRDVQDHATRVVAATDHMREMLMTAMQVNLSLVTVAQNEVVKKFSGWGAILVLPTVIFSLYGMNFKHMPELEWYLGYPAVLGATAVACGLLYRNLKKIGWI